MSLGKRLFTLKLGKSEIQYDTDYGIDRRSGWTVVYDGHVWLQFASFRRASWAWFKSLFRKPWSDDE